MKFHTIKYFLLLLLLIPAFSNAQEGVRLEEDGLPPVPSFQTSVYDYADILPGDKEKFLEQKLIRYSDSTSTQIVIATIPSVRGRDINLFATEWAHKWGIGRAGKDNGIFILVAPKDRKVAISTGYGVESRLTDALSRRIIENYMIPYFKKGDYFRGLHLATDVIFKLLTGEFKAEQVKHSNELRFWDLLVIIIIVLFIIWVLSKISGGRGGRGYTIDNPGGPVIFRGGGTGGFGGGFGGGSFGGGFSGGFGGGGFGGGGASGSW
jgi:uncharacterized protein